MRMARKADTNCNTRMTADRRTYLPYKQLSKLLFFFAVCLTQFTDCTNFYNRPLFALHDLLCAINTEETSLIK